jgi:hypothetical protein
VRALPIQQPFVELIFLGRKTVEYRSRPTNVRERVFVYATKSGPDLDEAAAWVGKNYGVKIDPASFAARGVLVGTVEIVGCRPAKGRKGVFEWLLAKPERLAKPQRPKKMPCSGGFFYPF